MAMFVECALCAERVTSPPGDVCPKCGTAYDPEMVRQQRIVHGLEVEPESEIEAEGDAGDEPAAAGGDSADTPAAEQVPRAMRPRAPRKAAKA